jgi:translation initiation factor IF-2
MNGQVVILNIDAVNISVGDTLLIKQQGQYFKAAIESIQLQDEDVQNCKEGEVGIKLNKSLKKNAEIFIRQG